MLTTLQCQTANLKMRIIELGWALSPPGCVHAHRLKQMNHDYSEMADAMGYRGEKHLFKYAMYIYLHLMGTHFIIRNLCDFFKASTHVEKYMNHYFENPTDSFEATPTK